MRAFAISCHSACAFGGGAGKDSWVGFSARNMHHLQDGPLASAQTFDASSRDTPLPDKPWLQMHLLGVVLDA